MYSSPRTKKKSLSFNNPCYKQKTGNEVSVENPENSDLIPLITYTDAPFCIFCKRPTAPLIKIPSGIFINLTGFTHEACLKNKGCCECGVLGLCYRCTVKDCPRIIHSWCAQALHGNSNFCDLHSQTHKKKESSRLPFIKSISRKVMSNSFWEKDYKEKDSPSSLCNGHIFWYLINLEYFPPGYDLTYFPVFPLCSHFELDYSVNESSGVDSEDYVGSLIQKVTADFERFQSINSKRISGVLNLLEESKKSRNKELVRAESFEPVFDEYLTLMDNNPKPFEASPTSLAGLRMHSLHNEILASHKDTEGLCSICLEDDFEETVLTCSICGIIVHPKCYKIQSCNNFTCEVCKVFQEPTEVSCVFCPKLGGAFKQTVHAVQDLIFPDYRRVKAKSKKDAAPIVWIHAFCASHSPGVVFRLQGVDLLGIDRSRLNILCEICKSKEGFCMQCSFNRCSATFHPECGKDLFVSSKSNEKKIYCALHKPLKLRKMLEMRQKKISEDIHKFSKAMEKYLNKVKAPVKAIKRKRSTKNRCSSGKIFTQDEDLALEYRIQQFLYKLNVSQKKPFVVSINLQASTRCSRVSVARPQFYTLVVPHVILEESLSIESRSIEECFKRYQDTLFSRLKNEILLLGNRLCVYQGKELPVTKHYIRHKKKSDSGIRVSTDRYCICNQPYYYEIPWGDDLTQDQWEEKVKENEMIECTKCEKWFHLKCVNYEGNLEKAQQDENWRCGLCDKKKAEKTSHLDQSSIISDINQGVVTRRGTKIH